MPKDESTFDFDFSDDEVKEEVTEEVGEEVFISNVLGPKGHLTNSHSMGGVLRVLHFKCEASKDFTKESRFLLCRLPQSQIRLLGGLSSIYGTIDDFVVGWAGFQNRYRERKEGMADGILSKDDSHVLGRTKLLSTVFDSLDGIEIYATALCDGKKGDYIEGIFIYVKK